MMAAQPEPRKLLADGQKHNATTSPFAVPLQWSGSADVCSIMNLCAAIEAHETGILKKILVDLRVAFFVAQLTGMQIAMFFRIFTTPFCHRFSPWLYWVVVTG